MATLYLRNVPDEVVERLQRLAEQSGTSVSAFAARELALLSRRADNETLLSSLPDLDVKVPELLGLLEEGRAER